MTPSAGSVGIHAGNPSRLSTFQSLSQLFKEILQSPRVWDGIKVFGIGAAIAGAKAIAESIWAGIKSMVLSRATIRGGTDPFDWTISYITRTVGWEERAREVEVVHGHGSRVRPTDDGDVPTQGDASVHFVPLESSSVHFKFQGTHVWATRSRSLVGDSTFEEALHLSFLTLSSATIRDFVAVAKASYEDMVRGYVHVFQTDRYHRWSRSKSISRRLRDSLYLPPGVKDRVLSDANHFCTDSSRLWYGDRGIPHRRGYLFYGSPGSGKTSLAHVMASELGRPVYQLTLSGVGMDDNKFTELMDDVSPNSIVLLEDVDAAFPTRASGSTAKSGQPNQPGKKASMVSFSALLNAIDGIGASESRMLVMTTNHRERLDEALIRPGRIDVQIEFGNATQQQSKELFLRWFEPTVNRHRKALSAEEQSTRVLGQEKQLDSTDGPVGSQVSRAAQRFAESVPEGKYSVAALQGFLLSCHDLGPDATVSEWTKGREEI